MSKATCTDTYLPFSPRVKGHLQNLLEVSVNTGQRQAANESKNRML